MIIQFLFISYYLTTHLYNNVLSKWRLCLHCSLYLPKPTSPSPPSLLEALMLTVCEEAIKFDYPSIF